MPKHDVPQFIETKQKVLGPLTFSQLASLIGVVTLLVVLYFVLPTSLFIFLVLVVLGVTGFFMFGNIKGMNGLEFTVSYFSHLTKTKRLAWKRDAEKELEELTPRVPKAKKQTKKKEVSSETRLEKEDATQKIRGLAKKLDQ